MIGTKIYPKKSGSYTFLALYALLAIIGGILSVLPAIRGQNPHAAAGFMLIFGLGMFFLTLSKSRKPQLSLFQDFVELHQTRTKQLIRYRNITAVSRPDKMKMTVTLREDGEKKEVCIWLKDLDPADAERVYDFLFNRGWKSSKEGGKQ